MSRQNAVALPLALPPLPKPVATQRWRQFFSHFLKRSILIPDHDPTSPVAENRGSDQTGRREGIEGTVPEVQHPAATAPGRLKKSWLMGVILLTLRSNWIEGCHKRFAEG